jgi:hypothetical protein
MDRIDNKIDNKTEWLHNELRDMESRICKTFDEKINNMDKNTEYKVSKAKDIEDERFRRIDEQHREHERRLDSIDRNMYQSYDRRNINSRGELDNNNNG